MKKVVLNKKEIGSVIKEYRLKNNISINEFASEISIKNPKQILKWENGLVIPSLDNIIKICNLFSIKVDELISFSMILW